MELIKQAVAAAFSVSLAAGLVACSDEPPTIGQKIDQANADLRRKAEEVKQDVKAATTEAAKDVKEASAEVAKDVREQAGDALITTKVKTALVQEPGLASFKIHVDTANGVVTLSGMVDSIEKSSRAREIAQAVDGVTLVQNHLVVGATTG